MSAMIDIDLRRYCRPRQALPRGLPAENKLAMRTGYHNPGKIKRTLKKRRLPAISDRKPPVFMRRCEELCPQRQPQN
jgi:hypothetical protein